MENVSIKIKADYKNGTEDYIRIPDGNGGYTDEIKLDLIKDENGNLVNDYYITNLPKYTTTGEIITYTVEEVKVNDTSFDTNGKCTLNGDDLYVDIADEPYIVNQHSNSDDLNPIVITNVFKGSTSCTVNKIWKDDTNALNTRTDLYIKLFRHSTQTGNDKQVEKDYLWKKKTGDTDNHWSYTYRGLAKYDDEGSDVHGYQDRQSSLYQALCPKAALHFQVC
jgi:hypothetical protein